MSFSPTRVFVMLGIPPFFKEIFKHLPNALLDLISWREMLAEVTVLSNRLLTNKGGDEVLQNIQRLLPAGVQTTKELSDEKLTITQGEKILELYFSQIMKGERIFLDFRPKHFSARNDSLEWNPGGLWAEFEPDFRDGLKMIYEGYYSGNDELFAKGMQKCGLSNKPQVLEVFKKHFGNGRDEKTAFDIEVFKESFAQIFKTLVENKIELDKNFLYLGIMLVTLYITLDQIGGAYDVSGIFKRSH